MIVNKQTREVLATRTTRGKMHDCEVFRQSNYQIAGGTVWLADSCYQGIQNEDQLSQTPTKKPKGGELTAEQKRENLLISRERICVENVIRHIKIFRIVSERYRNRRRRFGLRFNLIAGLYNYELNY